MKECCKSDCDKKTQQTSLRKWLNYLLYAVIALIVLGALFLQLFDKK
tara:strand:- start:47 stop:187 length:141 start_codon:yes stop_codon:yes gene_type:complete